MPADPEAQRVEVAGRRLRLTSLSKVMYPSSETNSATISLPTQHSSFWLRPFPLPDN